MGPWGKIVENISSKLAFFPPEPSTYEVRQHNDGTGDLYIHPLIPDIPKCLHCTVKVIPTRPTRQGGGKTEIVTAFFPHKHQGQPARLTLLYSHGNAVDLGHMLPVYRELARLLKVNVIGYDYSGYGCSTGQPSVFNTLADVTAVLDLLQRDYHVPSSQVILYGQSVGSGPSVYLASERSDIAGVVLHSPILSGVRVLKPNMKWWPSWADVYPNHLLAPKIKRPVLVMHGTDDEVIHICCGKRLYDLCPNKVEPLWAPGYGHQNMELCAGYLPALEGFITRLLRELEKS